MQLMQQSPNPNASREGATGNILRYSDWEVRSNPPLHVKPQKATWDMPFFFCCFCLCMTELHKQLRSLVFRHMHTARPAWLKQSIRTCFLPNAAPVPGPECFHILAQFVVLVLAPCSFANLIVGLGSPHHGYFQSTPKRNQNQMKWRLFCAGTGFILPGATFCWLLAN